ncbi:MAG TPA: GNAT family N-acetyltransferase [Rhizomicrobium sp.]|nr:GNAT family N-acetyltransferase [Rhizomicrobium sp.]
MALSIRQAGPDDAKACGRICFDAFAAIANAHNFPPDFPNVEAGVHLVTMMLAHPGVFGVVAEEGGKIVGSKFLDERGTISGVGPISVDPEVQNRGVGRMLMQAVMQRSADRNHAGIRLLQAGYYCRSFSLYSKLGFAVREHLTCLTGKPIARQIASYEVRTATDGDIAACDALCTQAHGVDRHAEVEDAMKQHAAHVVERGGKITGYATHIAYFGHAVAETTEDLKALIANAAAIPHPGFLVPSRNGELLRWCFANGLRMSQSLTLMTMGLYNEPARAWLPSILY